MNLLISLATNENFKCLDARIRWSCQPITILDTKGTLESPNNCCKQLSIGWKDMRDIWGLTPKRRLTLVDPHYVPHLESYHKSLKITLRHTPPQNEKLFHKLFGIFEDIYKFWKFWKFTRKIERGILHNLSEGNLKIENRIKDRCHNLKVETHSVMDYWWFILRVVQ